MMNISRNPIRFGVIGLFAVALVLFASAAFSSDVLRVESAPVISTKAEAAVFWRAAPDVRNTTAITFRPLPALALKSLQEENSSDSNDGLQAKPLKIGVNRNADTEINADTPPALNWKNNGDGYVARWAVTSPGAKGMRAALRLRALPDNAELRFSGSAEPERIIGVISGQEANALRDDGHVYWTPVTEGETQNIEIYLPLTVKPEDVKIRLNAVSHLFTSAQNSFDGSAITKTLSCEVNVACKFASLGVAFQNATKAVARMVTTDTLYSYGCTGTLLNSANSSQTPYFWTASHCLDSSLSMSAQQMANTLNTYWFDEAVACSGTTRNPDYRQLAGGATILHNQKTTDTALLQLKNNPPTGAVFSGWDANRFLSGNFVGIHHPTRDLKKVSTGSGQGYTCDVVFDRYFNGTDNANLTVVSWLEGLVEPASSGSGLFTLSNGAYYLRGSLSSGAVGASCSDVGKPVETSRNVFCYSSLSLVYNSIKQYLGNSSPAPNPPVYGPTRQYTGQWYRQGEDNWGLTVLMNFPGNARYIFVPWYIYDSSGKASWYIFEGDTWSASDKITLDVYRFTGPNWGAMPYDNSRVAYSKVGTATLTFTSATAATFQYNVENASRTITLTKLE